MKTNKKSIFKISQLTKILSMCLAIIVAGVNVSVPMPIFAATTVPEGKKWNFNFESADVDSAISKVSDHVYKWEAPVDGVYELEAIGAGGGRPTGVNINGGYGGKTVGDVELFKGDVLYIYVGEQGSMSGSLPAYQTISKTLVAPYNSVSQPASDKNSLTPLNPNGKYVSFVDINFDAIRSPLSALSSKDQIIFDTYFKDKIAKETFNGGGFAYPGNDCLVTLESATEIDPAGFFTYGVKHQWSSGSGGGATDFRLIKASGEWNDNINNVPENSYSYSTDVSLQSRILVAGGGGGLISYNNGVLSNTHGNHDSVGIGQTFIFGKGQNTFRSKKLINSDINDYVGDKLSNLAAGGGGGYFGGMANTHFPSAGSKYEYGFHGSNGVGGTGFVNQDSQKTEMPLIYGPQYYENYETTNTDQGQNIISGDKTEEKNTGHGYASIRYEGPIKRTLTLELGVNGSYDANEIEKLRQQEGIISVTEGVANNDDKNINTLEILGEYKTEITLKASKRNGYLFRHYIDLWLKPEDQVPIYSGTKYQFNLENGYYRSYYKLNGLMALSVIEKNNEKYIHLDEVDDDILKYYQFYASEDGGKTYLSVNTGGYTFDPQAVEQTWTSTGTAQVFKVRGTGKFTLHADGGRGRGSSGDGNQKCICGAGPYKDVCHAHSKTGGLTNGNTVRANMTLRYGDTLYVYVGGNGTHQTGSNVSKSAGFNGGNIGIAKHDWSTNEYNGAGCSKSENTSFPTKNWHVTSGGSGGATDFRLNGTGLSNRILAAGGGGSAGAVSTIYYGCDMGTDPSLGRTKYDASDDGPTKLEIAGSLKGSKATVHEGSEAGEDEIARRIYGAGGGGWYGSTNFEPGKNGWSEAEKLEVEVLTNEYCKTKTNGKAWLTYNDTETKVFTPDDFKINPMDILAPDAPNPESKQITPISDTQLKVNWNDCKDNGNQYVYKAVAFEGDGTEAVPSPLYDSNTINIDATSGTKGYHYYVDKKVDSADIKAIIEGMEINAPCNDNEKTIRKALQYVDASEGLVALSTTETQYLHVAAVDHAGNIGEVTTYEIPYCITITYHNNQKWMINTYKNGDQTPITGSITGQSFVSGENSIVIRENNINTLPEGDVPFERPGYIFKGWNTKAAGKGTALTPGQEYSPETFTQIIKDEKIKNNQIVLYAQWEPELFKITFDTNLPYSFYSDAKNVMPKYASAPTSNAFTDTGKLTGTRPQKVVYLSSFLNQPAYEGYWCTGGLSYTKAIKGKDTPNVLDYGGALPQPSLAGYTLVGWNTKADGTGLFVTSKTAGATISFTNSIDSQKYKIPIEYTTFDMIAESLNKTKEDYNFDYTNIADIPHIKLYAIWTNEALKTNNTHKTYVVSTVTKEADTAYYKTGSSILKTQYDIIDKNGNIVATYTSEDEDLTNYKAVAKRVKDKIANNALMTTAPDANGNWNLIRKTLTIQATKNNEDQLFWAKNYTVKHNVASQSHGIYAMAQYLISKESGYNQFANNNIIDNNAAVALSGRDLPEYYPFGYFYNPNYNSILNPNIYNKTTIHSASLLYTGRDPRDVENKATLTQAYEYQNTINYNQKKIQNGNSLQKYINTKGNKDTYNLLASYPSCVISNEIDYNVQGDYYVVTETATINWARNNIAECRQNIALNDPYEIRLATHGYGGYAINVETAHIQVDKTAPIITDFQVDQSTLDDYPGDNVERTAEELRNYMTTLIQANNFVTTFSVNVTDKADFTIAGGKHASDTSGIRKVLLYVYDVKNPDTTKKTYVMNKITGSSYTYSANLYKEFPKISYLGYTVIAIDNAGNYTELASGMNYSGSHGMSDDGYPIGDFKTDPTNRNPFNGGAPRGYLYNFSIKTAIYNDDDAFNYDNQTYFKANGEGFLDIWTIGYVESVALNFLGYKKDGSLAPGLQSVEDIQNGRIPDPNLYLGVYGIPGYEDYQKILSLHIKPAATKNPGLTKIDVSGMGNLVKAVDGTNTTYPYAALITVNDVLIPPGSDVPIPEYWKYEVIGLSGEYNAITKDHYIITSDIIDDIHYRVTHQS